MSAAAEYRDSIGAEPRDEPDEAEEAEVWFQRRLRVLENVNTEQQLAIEAAAAAFDQLLCDLDCRVPYDTIAVEVVAARDALLSCGVAF